MAFAEEALLVEGPALAAGRRKKLSQTPGLQERRKAAPDSANPEREAGGFWNEGVGLTGKARRGTNPERRQLCRRSLIPAPHLFLQLVSGFLEQFHDLPDDVILCKRAWVPRLLSTRTASRSGLPRRTKPPWVPQD